jgi:uncharacterized YigZ family protein
MVDSDDAAQEFITAIKHEFPDASHNCWAYLIGPPGSTDKLGLSDDGEPHGTAGKPLMTTLQHSQIGDIAVVVTRYFGGIKLGKGGMVKAYTQAVQAALEQVQTAEKINWVRISADFSYPLLEKIEQLLPEYEAMILNRTFSEHVTLELKLPAEILPYCHERLVNLSAARIKITTQEHNE